MRHNSNSDGSTDLASRLRKVSLTKRERKALSSLRKVLDDVLVSRLHEDTEALRSFSDVLFKSRKVLRKSAAQFEIDPATNEIYLRIYDADDAALEVKLTPEQVVEGLKELEQTDDNERALSSFFIDPPNN